MRILHVGYGFLPLRHGGVILYAHDLMDEQLAAGHEVGYFFAGRQSPVGPRNQLRSWSRNGVAMREVANSTLIWGGTGTLTPHADLNHAPTEAAFEEVLTELRPDIVHLHELVGVPSSLIDLARDRGVPVIATLQDYLPLCPIIKLYDIDGNRCLRREPGAQCRRCCAWAPPGPRWMIDQTIRYELRERLPGKSAGAAVRAFDLGLAAERSARARLNPGPPGTPSAAAYQARRDRNVERLSRLDALILQSRRAAEIYIELGVAAQAVRIMQFTLRHIDHLTARNIPAPSRRVRFVTLAGCASVEKGSEVVLGALELLAEAGLGDRFELTVFGWSPRETRRRLARFPNVQYAGTYVREEVDRILDGFDVGIVPSIWEESYGYVGTEMLAKGIPVIGNARGGIVDYTRDGETGWVNGDASAAGLASIMADIVARPEQVSNLSASIRRNRARIIKPFAEHAREIEDVYRAVTAARASGVSP